MSYLSVGTLEEGEEWYRQHYPQMPDELLPMLARYSFGDLGTWTNKELEDGNHKEERCDTSRQS